MTILLLLPFLVAGVTIAWVFGVKSDKDNKKVCDKHYKEKTNEKNNFIS